MNEVENHYANQPHGTNSASASASSGVGAAVATARSGIKQATETVKDTLDSARRTASDTYDRVSHTASDYYESASRSATYARRRASLHANHGRRNVEGFVEENPVMIGVAGVAVGLLVGTLLPKTRRENELFGRYADEVRDQGYRYAADLAAQGRQFVDESLKAATPGAEQR